MNIPFDGRGVFSNSITIYFHADLAKFVEGRGFSVIYVNNPSLTGFFRLDKESQTGFFVVNTVGDTSKPEAGNAAADVSEKKLVELVRVGIGVADYPLTIDGVARWRSVSDVARHYQAAVSSSPATPPTSCRRTVASAAIPAYMTRTISPGKWRWC
jgi:hypothetical protein